MVDLIVILLVAAFVLIGYQQGFLASVASFVGFLGGAVIGLQVSAPVARFITSSSTARIWIAIGVVLGLALLVQVTLVWAAQRLRRKLTWRPARVVDHLLGAVVSAVAALLVAWMVATPLATSQLPSLARQVKESEVVRAIDGAIPSDVRGLYESLRDLVGQQGLPDVLDAMSPTDVPDIGPPDSALADSPVVAASQDAIVKVVGHAPSCQREIDGTGFLYSEDRVMTNAHVLAGVEDAVVETTTGTFDATPVYVDEATDIAVLAVPDLDVPALSFGPAEAEPGADSIVAGYPGGGPFTASAARVREVGSVQGPDFREQSTVTREVYTLRGTVRPGNSGGPLLSADGTVLGVIFASAVDDPDVGYALTYDQIAPAVSAGETSDVEVDTGSCV